MNNIIISKKKYIYILILIGFSLFINYPLLNLTKTVGGRGDAWFHLSRLLGVAESIKNGIFPARLNGIGWNSYGSAELIMYPCTFLYPFAFLYNLTNNYALSYNALFIFINIISALIMYYSAYKIYDNLEYALVTSIIWIFAPYRLTDIYIRMSVGELLGAAFMPLYILGLYYLFADDYKKNFILIFSTTLIIRSHILTTIFAIFIAILFFILNINKFNLKRLKYILYSLLFILLFNINIIFPILDYMRSYDMILPKNFDLARTALDAYNFWDFEIVNYSIKPLFFLLIILEIFYFIFNNKNINSIFKKMLIIALILTILTTNIFPWKYFNEVPVISMIQFPWRLSLPASVIISMLSPFLFVNLFDKIFRYNFKFIGYFLIIICLICSFIPYAKFDDTTITPIIFGNYDYAKKNAEILDVNLNEKYNGDLIYNKNDIEIIDYKHTYNKIELRYNLKNNKDKTDIILPLFNYPGYQCYDENNNKIELSENDNGQILISLDNSSNYIKTQFVGNKLWGLFDIISYMTIILYCFYILIKRSNI